jgi:hypothetical protein
MRMKVWRRRENRKAQEILRRLLRPRVRRLRELALRVMLRRNGAGVDVEADEDGGRRLWERRQLR